MLNRMRYGLDFTDRFMLFGQIRRFIQIKTSFIYAGGRIYNSLDSLFIK